MGGLNVVDGDAGGYDAGALERYVGELMSSPVVDAIVHRLIHLGRLKQGSADDVRQETAIDFIRLIRSGKCTNRNEIHLLLVRALRCNMIDWHRKNKRHDHAASTEHHQGCCDIEMFPDRQVRIAEVFRKLTERQQLLIDRRLIREWTFPEIEKREKIPHSSAEREFKAAMSRLQHEFRRVDSEPD